MHVYKLLKRKASNCLKNNALQWLWWALVCVNVEMFAWKCKVHKINHLWKKHYQITSSNTAVKTRSAMNIEHDTFIIIFYTINLESVNIHRIIYKYFTITPKHKINLFLHLNVQLVKYPGLEGVWHFFRRVCLSKVDILVSNEVFLTWEFQFSYFRIHRNPKVVTKCWLYTILNAHGSPTCEH